MANRVRPRCQKCQQVMDPVYGHGIRGKAYIRIADLFWCRDDGTVARGRRKVRFLAA